MLLVITRKQQNFMPLKTDWIMPLDIKKKLLKYMNPTLNSYQLAKHIKKLLIYIKQKVIETLITIKCD